jgi:hypothetical protein
MEKRLQRDIAKVLEGRSPPRRRVLIVKRRDGAFGLAVEKWRQNVFGGRVIAEGWAPFPSTSSVFETVEIAEREARAQFPWLY